MTLTTSHEVRGEGEGKRSAGVGKRKGRRGEGSRRPPEDISAAFHDFFDHSAKLKYDCSLCTGKGRNHLNEKLAALAGQAHSYINVV